MADPRRFEVLLDQIYEAALEPASWTVALETLNRALGSAGCALFYRDSGSAHVNQFVGQEASAVSAYNEYYYRLNPWIKIAARIPDGIVGCGHEWVDRSSFESGEFYNDWLRPQGLYDGIGHIISRNAMGLLALSALRSKRAGLYSGSEKRLMMQVSSHVRRAIDIHRRLSAARILHDGLVRGLDGLGVGAVLVGGDRRILFANRVAEAILQRGDELISKDGRLRAATPHASEELGRQIRAAASPGLRQSEPGGAVKLPTSGGRSTMVLVCPWRSEMRLGLADPAAIVFVNDSSGKRRGGEHHIARMYDLAPSEARLLSALLEGARLSDYADEAGITINTAKGYLKQLFSKTGTSRQSDLLRLILSDQVLRLASMQSTQ